MMTRPLSRRRLLTLSAGLGLATAFPTATLPLRALAAPSAPTPRRLTAAPALADLVGGGQPQTAVWAFDGQVPGPVLRFRQGDRLEVILHNGLPQPTTIHWHGLRLPNTMDGVPGLSQPAVEPGSEFTYAFDLPDAGTFWYHPHVNSAEQVGRGLSGALIVEEREPPVVDRDLVWVLSDWRLDPAAQQVEDFGLMHDISHAGRLGNTVTVNGRVAEQEPVRAGERIRLRLLNVANARIFALTFEGHAPQIIALDGQPVDPHAPEKDRIVLGPGQRADIILDLGAEPGSRHQVIDGYYPQQTYRLLELVYSPEAPLRSAPPDTPIRLADNSLPNPVLDGAARHEIVFGGGMGMTPDLMGPDGRPDPARMQAHMQKMRHLVMQGMAWTLNGHAMGEHHDHHAHPPLFTVERGRTVILSFDNRTRWPHPIHLHGQHMQVLSVNGAPRPRREMRDTVLLEAMDRAEVAFVADEPGDWMLHCHVLEHQAGGMMGTIRVV